jgi:hypothetical protein
MTDITPVGSPRFPVDRTARSLMACARRDPSLLSRSSHHRADDEPDPLRDLPAMFHRRTNIGRPDELFSDELYLEELVSLASEAAERAGDASRQAADATVALRHGRVAFALVGVLGMAIGLAAAAGSVWSGEERQSRIAGELTAVQTLQNQADRQLAAVAAVQDHPAPSAPTAAVAAPLPEPPAIVVRTDAVAPLPKPPLDTVATDPVAPSPKPSADTVTTDAVTPLPKPPADTVATDPVAPLPKPLADTVATDPLAPLPKPPAVTVATDAAAPLPKLHAITIATRQEWSAEPVPVPRSEARARVWTHRHRVQARRVYYYQSYPAGPPVILARMVQNIQRDVGALFR